METASWNEHAFLVEPTLIRGISELSIRAGIDTDKKVNEGQRYATKKSGKPHEISMNVTLNAMLGCEVRKEAMEFVAEAQAGAKNYFYLGGEKLLPCQMMLVSAEVSKIEFSGRMNWVSASVKLSFQQAEKGNGGDGSGSGGGGSSKKPGKKSFWQTAFDEAGKRMDIFKKSQGTEAVNDAVLSIDKLVNAAKAASKGKNRGTANKIIHRPLTEARME